MRDGSPLTPPPRPRGEAVSRVVEELREAIRAGTLAPGSRIAQVDLARQLGTSRLPVREALRQLHHEGLVTFVPNAGARVVDFDTRELEEIYWLREVIEPMLLARSVPGLTEDDLHQCRQYLDEMDSVTVDGPESAATWLEIDQRFHRATFSGARMPHALRLVEAHWNMVAHYRLMFAQLPGAYEFSRLEHRLILDALERRQPDDAAQLLLLHIRRTRTGLAEQLMQENGRGENRNR